MGVDAAAEQGAVEAIVERASVPARLERAPVAGASAARNAAWRAATAPLVLFIGDDVLASDRLLAEHAASHRTEPGELVAVLGSVTWARDLRVTPFMRWLDRGLQFDYGSISGGEAHLGHLYTANVSLKRSLLERAGGFDEELPYLYEDIELGYRLSRLGGRLLFNARAAAEHLHQVTPESYRERMRIAARAERALVAKHPSLEPTLHRRFSALLKKPPPRGRGARLAAFIPRTAPIVGPRVWASAEATFEREMAEAFEAEWSRAGQPGGGQPSGSPPGGPK